MNLNNEKVIRNLERDSFCKLKKEENKNRRVPSSKDILYISDFTLKKYSNNGDSGELYLATNKKNKEEKYIIKHEYYDCACNEYMYSKIGNKMGIAIAPVKLFVLDNKKNMFKSDFVCGIKYFENCKHVCFKDIKDNDEISNKQDYLKMIALETLFDEADGIEVIEYNNKIYRIDTTAAFTISDFDIHPLAYDYNNHGINVREFAYKNILKNSLRNTERRISSWNSCINYFIKEFGKQNISYLFKTFESLEVITEKDIEEWINILTYFYPNIIGEYFKNYIKNLKADVKEFIIKSKPKQKELIKS